MSKYTLTSVTYNRAFKDSHIFNVKVKDDNRELQYWSKVNPCDLKEGEEVEGEIETKVNGQYTNHTLKVKKGGKFGGGANPEVTKKVAALTNSVNLIIAGKLDLKHLEESCDRMLAILNK